MAAREAEAALDAAAAGAAAATLHAKAKRQLAADRQGRAGGDADSGRATGGAQPLANGNAGADSQLASEELRESSPATANAQADRQANGAGEAGSSVQVGLVVA